MLSNYKIALAQGTPIDPTMIWTIILIIIVVLLIIFGSRILLLIKGKRPDEDLDEDDFVTGDDE
jgi:hypothetical protein